MQIKQIIKLEHVLLGLHVTSKKRLFEELGFLFEQTVGMPHIEVSNSLFARERLGTTGLGYGVAVPHGRIKGLKEPQIAVIRLEMPLGFDALDGHPVDLLFALLVPENATQKHLDLLAEMAAVLGDESKRQALRGAASKEDFLAII